MLFVAGIIGLATMILFFGSILWIIAHEDDRRRYSNGCSSESAKKEPFLVRMAGPILILVVGMAVTISIAIGFPKYNVWQQEQEGAAELAKAEQNRQIAVQEAKAKEESAKSLANAEIIRAEGVAQANKIIGDSLQNNDAYIHYLWIEALKESHDQVIYIPTEAGIPVTESARFFKNK